jgi:hypothetical protein
MRELHGCCSLARESAARSIAILGDACRTIATTEQPGLALHVLQAVAIRQQPVDALGDFAIADETGRRNAARGRRRWNPSCPPSERVASNGLPHASASATEMPPGLPTTRSDARR